MFNIIFSIMVHFQIILFLLNLITDFISSTSRENNSIGVHIIIFQYMQTSYQIAHPCVSGIK